MTYSEIRAVCLNDSSLKQHFTSQLELILTVDQNYKHIIELECLRNCLKSGLGDYYKEYASLMNNITIFCGEVAECTRRNHYRSASEHVDDVYTYLEDMCPDKVLPAKRP
jgi:hypothetical protein